MTREVEKATPLTGAQIDELAGELWYDLRRLNADTAAIHANGRPAVGARGRERQALIEAALARIQAGTYGACLGCGEPIPYSRLAAIPETPTCIDCIWSLDGSRPP
jgi:RNA polymerase-binding transcription factor DksA